MNKKKKLYISFILRLSITIYIFMYMQIPLEMKIIFLILFDAMDCMRFYSKLFNGWIDCKSFEYQSSDKIVDTISYLILLRYIFSSPYLSYEYKLILCMMFIYRLIGTIKFIQNRDSKYLIYFPNFFLEFSLGFLLAERWNLSPSKRGIMYIVLFVYKIIQEMILHSDGKSFEHF